ncbi:hypothetical protein K6119_06460 [Paracrocinitomix mangrovi]|uniref:hypothetical protein n=1 Tax=Paracrocinitomix mangrovi TaxID=2862509 RepID=UPI001C8CF655|nr:hypothetical protein [Paracrocinitomix mangrovi]UKN03155.1 hypothetical protein K6119_06460 [Paracrocinitomix mangrovi]
MKFLKVLDWILFFSVLLFFGLILLNEFYRIRQEEIIIIPFCLMLFAAAFRFGVMTFKKLKNPWLSNKLSNFFFSIFIVGVILFSYWRTSQMLFDFYFNFQYLLYVMLITAGVFAITILISVLGPTVHYNQPFLVIPKNRKNLIFTTTLHGTMFLGLLYYFIEFINKPPSYYYFNYGLSYREQSFYLKHFVWFVLIWLTIRLIARKFFNTYDLFQANKVSRFLFGFTLIMIGIGVFWKNFTMELSPIAFVGAMVFYIITTLGYVLFKERSKTNDDILDDDEMLKVEIDNEHFE